MVDISQIQAYINQNPQVAIGIVVLVIVIFIFFVFFNKRKTDQVAKQLLLETRYSWGRDTIEEYTIKDLDKISRFMTKFNKNLIIGNMPYTKKVGKCISIMNMKTKKVETLNKKNEYVYSDDPPKEIYLLKFKIARWESLNFFPFSWFFTLKKYSIFTKDDILNSDTNTRNLHLKQDEFETVYGIYMPMSEALTKLAKIEEFVFKGFAEELTGRLTNQPAKTAQLDLKHTEELALTEKRAEIWAKQMQQTPTRTF